MGCLHAGEPRPGTVTVSVNLNFRASPERKCTISNMPCTRRVGKLYDSFRYSFIVFPVDKVTV